MRRVHEDQAVEPLGRLQDRGLHDHAAHRVTERHAPLPPERVEQPEQVGGEGLEGVRRLVGRAGRWRRGRAGRARRRASPCSASGSRWSVKSSLAPVKPCTRSSGRPPAPASASASVTGPPRPATSTVRSITTPSADVAEAAHDLGERGDLVGRRDLDVDGLAVVEELHASSSSTPSSPVSAPNAAPMSICIRRGRSSASIQTSTGISASSSSPSCSSAASTSARCVLRYLLERLGQAHGRPVVRGRDAADVLLADDLGLARRRPGAHSSTA